MLLLCALKTSLSWSNDSNTIIEHGNNGKTERKEDNRKKKNQWKWFEQLRFNFVWIDRYLVYVDKLSAHLMKTFDQMLSLPFYSLCSTFIYFIQ